MESVQRDPERTVYDTVKMNPRVQWRSQYTGTGTGKYLPRTVGIELSWRRNKALSAAGGRTERATLLTSFSTWPVPPRVQNTGEEVQDLMFTLVLFVLRFQSILAMSQFFLLE